MKTFWLSFADKDRFLGACIVEADGAISATIVAHVLGINPGGDVVAAQTTDEIAKLIPAHWRERLLSHEDITAFDVEMKPLLGYAGPIKCTALERQSLMVCDLEKGHEGEHQMRRRPLNAGVAEESGSGK